VSDEDVVLEIGTGICNLTKYLCQKAKYVYAVEKDKRLCKIAEQNLFGLKNVEVISNDILKVDLKNFLSFSSSLATSPSLLKVVGNLPYYITTPIIFKLLDQRRYISDIFIMVQKEVAQRIVARPGVKDYGILACSVQFYAQPTILFNIGKGAFSPQPKIDSSFIRLEILDKTSVEVKDEKLFFKIIKAAFGRRRKTLLNSLGAKYRLGMPKGKILEAMEKAGISFQRRPETLSLKEFAKIADFLL